MRVQIQQSYAISSVRTKECEITLSLGFKNTTFSCQVKRKQQVDPDVVLAVFPAIKNPKACDDDTCRGMALIARAS
jgi:hypothetical protein